MSHPAPSAGHYNGHIQVGFLNGLLCIYVCLFHLGETVMQLVYLVADFRNYMDAIQIILIGNFHNNIQPDPIHTILIADFHIIQVDPIHAMLKFYFHISIHSIPRQCYPNSGLP